MLRAVNFLSGLLCIGLSYICAHIEWKETVYPDGTGELRNSEPGDHLN